VRVLVGRGLQAGGGKLQADGPGKGPDSLHSVVNPS